MPLQNIKKRDGSIVHFDQEKITKAIWEAAQSVGGNDSSLAQKISNQVTAVLEVFFKNGESMPTVEQIQDLVEKILIENGHAKTAKAYILYRQKQTELRQKKEKVLGRPAVTKFSLSALKLLKQHFLLRAEDGTTIETPEEMMRRVAKNIAQADRNYDDFNPKNSEQEFYELLINLDFLPHGAILANAGTSHQQLLSYFKIKVEDSMESIFEEIKHTVLIYQNGGKTIINLSELRPKGTNVASTKGPASGPVAFLKIFDDAVKAIKQASKQGALTAILPIDHPDILEFLSSKDEGKRIEHFHLQVGITQAFIETFLQQKEYELINPQTGKAVNKLDAKSVFDILISKMANSQEIELIFMDRETLQAIKQNSTDRKSKGKNTEKYQIFANGSINIAHLIESETLNWQKFQKMIHTAVHFLDNVFDISKYPSSKIAEKALHERKINLGISGFAELLQNLRIPANSEKAHELGEKISFLLKKEADDASLLLAQKRGSVSEDTKTRNGNLIAIIPDSIVNSVAEKTAGIEYHSDKSDPESSIRIQAAFQKNSDGVVENTIFLPQEADVEELKKMVLLCYQAGCQYVRLVKSKTLHLSAKNPDEQIELPFHKIVEGSAQRKAKRQALKNEEKIHRPITPQKAEEVMLPPIIINS